jgi:predicted permease
MLVRFVGLFRRRRQEAEMNIELRAHLDALIERNLAAGMSLQEARNAAVRTFGGIEQVKESARDERRSAWVEQVLQDLRYAVRQLRKAPGFTAVIVVTLALSIGGCVTIFSILDQLVLRPFNLQPDSVIARHVTLSESRGGVSNLRVSPGNYLHWQQHAKSFELLRAIGRTPDLFLTGLGEPALLSGALVTLQHFQFDGAKPILGRSFSAEDFKPGAEKVVLLRYPAWQRFFGADPAVIGRGIEISGEPYTVIGVLDPKLERISGKLDVVLPLILTERDRENRSARYLTVWARLKPGVTLEQAQAEMDVISAQLGERYPDTNKGWGVVINTRDETRAQALRSSLWLLLGAISCVLLIACANIANLLLARASVRQREISVRIALGASRGRITRQLLVESLTLALLGGAAGILLATWALQAVHAYAGAGTRTLEFVEMNGGMVGFAVGLSVMTGIVFGLAPAWLASGVNINEMVKQSTRGSSPSRVSARLRSTLIVVEVAAAVLLLAAAGGLIRVLLDRARLDRGFEPDRAAVLRLVLPQQKYGRPEQRLAFTEALLAQMRAMPGVIAAGASSNQARYMGEFTGQSTLRFGVEGTAVAPGEWQSLDRYFPWASVTEGYFDAMGVRLQRGRGFSVHDSARSTRVAIINEAAARKHFPNDEPLGRRIAVTNGNAAIVWSEIVGVVDNVLIGNPRAPVGPQVYAPLAQAPAGTLFFVVRTRDDPAGVFALLRTAVHSIDRDVPITWISSLRQWIDDAPGFAAQRLPTHLLILFAGVALVLAAIGIYGVVCYSVAQCTTEIGIRRALGAQTRDIMRLVMVQGGRVVAAGLLIGAVAAAASDRVIEATLYRASVRDPLTLGAVVAFFAIIGALACWLPARRAARIDPMVALRTE